MPKDISKPISFPKFPIPGLLMLRDILDDDTKTGDIISLDELWVVKGSSRNISMMLKSVMEVA